MINSLHDISLGLLSQILAKHFDLRSSIYVLNGMIIIMLIFIRTAGFMIKKLGYSKPATRTSQIGLKIDDLDYPFSDNDEPDSPSFDFSFRSSTSSFVSLPYDLKTIFNIEI